MTKAFHAILWFTRRSSVAMLEVHRQHPVSKEVHKRRYEGHKSCKPEYFKLKTIAFPGSLYTYYLLCRIGKNNTAILRFRHPPTEPRVKKEFPAQRNCG
jgi:hypothetical protein